MGLYIGTKGEASPDTWKWRTQHANQEWGCGRLHQLSLRSQHGIQFSCSSHGSITRGDGSGRSTLGGGSIRGLDVPLGATFLPGGLCSCSTAVKVQEAALLHLVSRRQSLGYVRLTHPQTSSAGQALTCESLATPDNEALFKMAHL